MSFNLVSNNGVFRGALPGRVIGRLAVDVRWSRLLGTVVSGLLGCLVVGMLGIKGDAVMKIEREEESDEIGE